MWLHLTYNSSEEGIKLIKLFKYLKYNQTKVMMEYIKYELSPLELLIFIGDIAHPRKNKEELHPRTITNYDNIRTALKSIFPTLFDLTPMKRMPIRNLDIRDSKHRMKNIEHYVYWKDKGML